MYGWRGAKDVDRRHYEALEDATGYGSVDGLCGVNCRHGFGPYRAGAPRAYDPDPRHPSGLPGDEVYRLEQGQRRRERGIREAKRELDGARRRTRSRRARVKGGRHEGAGTARRAKGGGMREYVADANARSRTGRPVLHRRYDRESAGSGSWRGPLGASVRTLDEFLGGAGAARSLRSHGVGRAAARAAIVGELRSQGCAPRDFAAMGRGEQMEMLGRVVLARKKPTERELRRAKMKPVNEALYNSQKNYVERHGGQVQRGTEEALQHLRVMGVDAIYVMGAQTIYLHERPSASEVLEEAFHFKQDMRGDYSEYSIGLTRTLRERDAQRYLLEVAERYNIPKEETEQTRKALAEYLNDLRKAGYDEDFGLP